MATIPKNLVVIHYQEVIVATPYNYLGVELTSSLNLISQFNRIYQKVSSWLKTLHSIRHLLTNKSAKDIFSLTDLPTLSYWSLLKPSFSNTQVKKIRSLERRSKSLINNFDPNIINLLKKRVCFFVYKVTNQKICPPLNELKVSKINTRNNNYKVKLTKIKLEYGLFFFWYSPLEIRKQYFHKSFKSGLKSYLASNKRFLGLLTVIFSRSFLLWLLM